MHLYSGSIFVLAGRYFAARRSQKGDGRFRAGVFYRRRFYFHADRRFCRKQRGDERKVPVFYDVENEHGDETGSISNLDRQLLTDIIKTFCDTLRENNYYSGYYSNISFAKDDYYPEQLREYPFWLAQWGEINTCSYDFYLWQYSATGQVPGVNGDCDLDLCFADFESYIREQGYNNLKK